LSNPESQLRILDNNELPDILRFSQQLNNSGLFPLRPRTLETLQINVGKTCNQTCTHCHVDAGPDRKEIMTSETMTECVEVVKKFHISSIDITGGAPELNPNFQWLVETLSKLDVKIIVRTNLTIIVSNPSLRKLPDFFKKHNIHLIASLPCYTLENTDGQRGRGVFNKSIAAIHLLNQAGYGLEEDLVLDFVYNPFGAFLPGDQTKLETNYKKILKEDHGIHFNKLYTITNLPISRFLDYLVRSEKYDSYMELLSQNFNPKAAEEVMCRDMISVGWNGYLYDCDFNQMLEMKIDKKYSNHIRNFDLENLGRRNIKVNQHCYACTAGSGSSCGGSLV